jgi:hypothetical protein
MKKGANPAVAAFARADTTGASALRGIADALKAYTIRALSRACESPLEVGSRLPAAGEGDRR